MINAKVEGIEKYRRFHIPVAPPKKNPKAVHFRAKRTDVWPTYCTFI